MLLVAASPGRTTIPPIAARQWDPMGARPQHEDSREQAERVAFKRLPVAPAGRSPLVAPCGDPTEARQHAAQWLRRSVQQPDSQPCHLRGAIHARLPFEETITTGAYTAEAGTLRIPVPGTQRVGRLGRFGVQRRGIRSELG